MNQGDRPLVHFFLVVVLVLNKVQVDKIAQVGAGVPADVVGVNVNLAQMSNHFSLVGGV